VANYSDVSTLISKFITLLALELYKKVRAVDIAMQYLITTFLV
jgi:hypothetical protein